VCCALSRIRISPTRRRRWRGAGVRRQPSKASPAAAMASSMSFAVECGKRPMRSRVSAGFRFSLHSPEPRTHRPPM
jgi:hypothetical protein